MTTEKLPIELSADGKRNCFNHYCGSVGHSKNYAVCVHLLSQHDKKGELPGLYSDCNSAMGGGRCPARKMRAEEREKGEAIYFTERVRSERTFMEEGQYVEHIVSSRKRSKPGKTKPAKQAPASKEEQFLSGGGDYADAINEVTKPVQAAFTGSIESKPGESLLEMAQRIMKQNANKEATV